MASPPFQIALLHGASYAGGQCIRLLQQHPAASLTQVTSRTFAGHPLWAAHPELRGTTDLPFTAPDALDLSGVDAILLAAEHGRAASVVQDLQAQGYDGPIVDLSADFRLRDAKDYPAWYQHEHPAPDLLDDFVYGLADVLGPYPDATRYVANPGCFATGLALALWPLRDVSPLRASVTALTGASGSGATPKATTHYPTRDGNVRAYKVLRHQHLPEVLQHFPEDTDLRFVPVSGPWTRGIWGTAHLTIPDTLSLDHVTERFTDVFSHAPLVRLSAGQLPELRATVGTPFCDLGWVVQDGHLVIGFALDNLLKGAASQAVQNLNLLLNLPMTTGLLPTS